MAKEFTHTFTVSDEQLEELELLQKAMQKESDYDYTLQEVFDFVMMLGQNHMISDRIENAAWHYAEYYEEGTYKYKYGKKKIVEENNG